MAAHRTWWTRWRRLLIVLVGLQVAYVGSYAALYYRGVSEADAVGLRYFFYVPVADVVEARGTTRRHLLLMALYEPLNDLHSTHLGGRSACRCILFGLSKDRPPPRPDTGVAPDAGPKPVSDQP